MCQQTDDPLVLRVRCAPRKAPCPRCGTPARRKRMLRRRVRTLAYRRVAWLEVSYGEYQARCGCCRSFHTTPEGVLPKAAYDNKVRQAVLGRRPVQEGHLLRALGQGLHGLVAAAGPVQQSAADPLLLSRFVW